MWSFFFLSTNFTGSLKFLNDCTVYFIRLFKRTEVQYYFIKGNTFEKTLAAKK